MRVLNNDITCLNKAKELLIVIDMVNGFVKEGPLADKHILGVVPKQIEKIKEALDKNDVIVIFVRDAHTFDAKEFTRYPKHCLKNSEESNLIDELKPFEKDSITYLKNSTNLIYSMQKDLLNLDNLERVNVMGCLSEVCVFDGATSLRTFFDEYDKKVDVGVFKDCIDTYDSETHRAKEVTKEALELMQNKGIIIL